MLWPLLCLLFTGFPLSASGAGYMSTLATMWGSTSPQNSYAFCAIQAQVLLPTCYGTFEVENNTQPPNHTQFWSISAGGYFSCGLTYQNHTPVCWGQDPGSNVSHSFKNVKYSNLNAGGWHACAVRADGSGSVDCWGNNAFQQSSPPKEQFTSVTCGDTFTCGLSRNTNKTVCWGSLSRDVNPSEISDPEAEYSAVYAGRQHMCGIEKGTRKTLCWGINDYNQSQPPSQFNFSAISGGYRHTCGIRDDTKEAVCWGDNTYGQLKVPNGVPFSIISAGDWYTCGVRLDKPMHTMCWGSTRLNVENVSETPCYSKCGDNQYEMNSTVLGSSASCPKSSDKICIACSICSSGAVESTKCGSITDTVCRNISVGPNITIQSPVSSPAKSNRFPGVVVAVVVSIFALFAVFLALLYWKFCSKKTVKKPGPWENPPERVEAFTSSELLAAAANYSASMLLGRGAFGMVYKGVLQDGRVVAIKKSTNSEISKSFDQELQLLAKLHHTYLVNLIGFCSEEKILVFEFMENGSLYDCLFARKAIQLDWKMRLRIAVQASRGLEYLHAYANPSIIHRDVKCSNILLDKEWNAHVSDFGLSLIGPAAGDTHLSNLTVMGTPGYLDPEYFLTLKLTAKSDVYSFGVVILELLTGRKAFDQEQPTHGVVGWISDFLESNQIVYVLDKSVEAPPDTSSLVEALELGLNCVRPKGKDRPTMAAVALTLETCLEKLVLIDHASSSRFTADPGSSICFSPR